MTYFKENFYFYLEKDLNMFIKNYEFKKTVLYSKNINIYKYNSLLNMNDFKIKDDKKNVNFKRNFIKKNLL